SLYLLLLLLIFVLCEPHGHGRQPAEVRRIHPRNPSGAPDRRVPRHDPDAADLRRLDLSGTHRAAPDDPDFRPQRGRNALDWTVAGRLASPIPDPGARGEVLLRRNLAAHRGGGGHGYGPAGRVSADHAALRGLP